jgi:copper(I)-binding protein
MMRRLCALLVLAAFAINVHATSTAPALSAEHGWIRLLPAGLPAAGYVTLKNATDRSARLVSVTSDAFGDIMLHQSLHAGGVERMRMVDGIDVPAHGEVSLSPGSYHLMLMQPTYALKAGEQVVMVLHFADGGSLSAAFEVRPANADGQ